MNKIKIILMKQIFIKYVKLYYINQKLNNKHIDIHYLENDLCDI